MIDPSTIDLKSLPWLPLDEKTAFPKRSAIYFAIDSLGNVQYIGRSQNVHGRWTNHHRYDQLSTMGGVKIAYLFVDLPKLLPEVEVALIEYFDPPLNTIKVGSATSNTIKTGGGGSSINSVTRYRKARAFRLDEAVIDGLTELAKQENTNANRLLENMLFEILKSKGVLSADIKPLGETRGGDRTIDISKEIEIQEGEE